MLKSRKLEPLFLASFLEPFSLVIGTFAEDMPDLLLAYRFASRRLDVQVDEGRSRETEG